MPCCLISALHSLSLSLSLILYDDSYPLNRRSDIAWPFPFSVKRGCLRPLGFSPDNWRSTVRTSHQLFCGLPRVLWPIHPHAGSGPFQSMIRSDERGHLRRLRLKATSRSSMKGLQMEFVCVDVICRFYGTHPTEHGPLISLEPIQVHSFQRPAFTSIKHAPPPLT